MKFQNYSSFQDQMLASIESLHDESSSADSAVCHGVGRLKITPEILW